MSIQKSLELRGALSFLNRALFHIGKNQPVDEWGTGEYLNKPIAMADNALRYACWLVEKELNDLQKG